MKQEKRIPGLLEIYNVQAGERNNAIFNELTETYEFPTEGPVRVDLISPEIAKKCSEQFKSAFEHGVPTQFVTDLITSIRNSGDEATRKSLFYSESNISMIPIITDNLDLPDGYQHPYLSSDKIPGLMEISKKVTNLVRDQDGQEITLDGLEPTADQMETVIAGLIKHLDFFSKNYPGHTETKAEASRQLVKKWAQGIAAIASGSSGHIENNVSENRVNSAKYNNALFSLATLIDGSQVYGGIEPEN